MKNLIAKLFKRNKKEIYGTEGIVYKKTPEEADAEIKALNKHLKL